MSSTREKKQRETVGSYNRRQQLFVRYLFGILIDLTVLNLFDEYWDFVSIGSFTISLLAAVLLQVLLRITFNIEHRIGEFFRSRPGKYTKILRIVSAWAILFGSKFAILEAVNIAFGERVVFSGPLHGVVAFIAVVIAMISVEMIAVRIKESLG